jgi:hypothetical protein
MYLSDFQMMPSVHSLSHFCGKHTYPRFYKQKNMHFDNFGHKISQPSLLPYCHGLSAHGKQPHRCRLATQRRVVCCPVLPLYESNTITIREILGYLSSARCLNWHKVTYISYIRSRQICSKTIVNPHMLFNCDL